MMLPTIRLTLLYFVLLPFTQAKTPIVVGVDGGTESIRACCFNALNGNVVGESCAVPYKTTHPNPGWAEQDPNEWYENLCSAVRGALESVQNIDDMDVKAMCIDTTCCSVVALDEDYVPLRPSLLWMDARSASQTVKIMDICKGDPALDVNSGGEGPLSAEWFIPKSLWIKENEPEVYDAAKTVCEYQDYINYRLTGKMCASSCTAAVRWHWNGEEAVKTEDSNDLTTYPGRPVTLLAKLGMSELLQKMPKRCIPMGSLVGNLTKDAAARLGLSEGLPVAQGGPDAFVGMIGLGCIHPGQLCLITGSSHLHCCVSSKPSTAQGTWGAYAGAPLPGICFAEGGQSSTGSLLRWMKTILGNNNPEAIQYKDLDDEASIISPGSDGLIALETFQGSRTPVTDARARGAFIGLTLSHTRAHIWRSLMEAVCLGTKACIDGLDNAGHNCREIVIAGGATRSPLWLQMHADVTGKPVVVCENTDAPLLGCAILASVCGGVHENVEAAVNAMVREKTRILPNPSVNVAYETLYSEVYSKVSPSIRSIVHKISEIRGGSNEDKIETVTSIRNIIVSPSLLASDWSNINEEVKRCERAGANWIHVDVFDGVFLDSPYALTFGPQMVKAIRRSCTKDTTILDIHLCVDRPRRYIEAMKKSGADRIIFQIEAMYDAKDALLLAKEVKLSGMKCGVSINPSTPITHVLPLVFAGAVDLVDILAVEPGFGGQQFQRIALEKIKALKSHINQSEKNIKILVDGGVNQHTSSEIIDAGADILVAGTFLFKHKDGLAKGVSELLGQ